MLVLDSDIDGAVGSLPEVFHSVLERREPPRLARLGKHLLCLAIFIGEAEMPSSKDDNHASGMRVHLRIFMRSIMDVHDLNILVLKSQFVMCGLDLCGILSKRHGAEKQNQQRGAE